MTLMLNGASPFDVASLVVIVIISIILFTTMRKSDKKFIYFAAGLLFIGIGILVDVTGIPGWRSNDVAWAHGIAQMIGVALFFVGVCSMRKGFCTGFAEAPRRRK